MDSPRVDDADLPAWRTLWEEDRPIDPPGPAGAGGKLTGWLKSLFRRLTTSSQKDLWERQRLYNMLVQHHLEGNADREAHLGLLRDLDVERKTQVEELYQALTQQDLRLLWLEDVHKKGLERIVEHHDAVYAMVDRKIDQYRQQTADVRRQHEALYANGCSVRLRGRRYYTDGPTSARAETG